MSAPPDLGLADLRLDKLLWYLRLSKSRSQAQALIEEGHIRINGERAVKTSVCVHAGDVITLPRVEGVMAIRIDILPQRRGPAAEAQSHYSCL